MFSFMEYCVLHALLDIYEIIAVRCMVYMYFQRFFTALLRFSGLFYNFLIYRIGFWNLLSLADVLYGFPSCLCQFVCLYICLSVCQTSTNKTVVLFDFGSSIRIRYCVLRFSWLSAIC